MVCLEWMNEGREHDTSQITAISEYGGEHAIMTERQVVLLGSTGRFSEDPGIEPSTTTITKHSKQCALDHQAIRTLF